MLSSPPNIQQPAFSQRNFAILLLFLTAYFLLSRLLKLDLYPALHPDEGFWYLPAKHASRGESPLVDGRLHPFLAPLQYLAARIWFEFLPASIHSARSLSVLFGCVTFFGATFLLRRSEKTEALSFLTILSLSAPIVLSQRLSLLEPIQFCLLFLALLCVVKGEKLFLAGLLFGAAFLIKINVVYIAPAFFVAALHSQGKTIHAVGRFTLGAALIVAPAALTLTLYFPEELSNAFRYELDGKHFLNEGVLFSLGRIGLHPQRLSFAVFELLKSAPFLLLLAALTLRSKELRSDPRVRFAAMWLFIGFFFLSFQIFVVPRYYITFYPALILLAVLGFKELSLRYRHFAVAIALAFILYHGARVWRGIDRASEGSLQAALASIQSQNCPQDKLLSSSSVALSSPIPAYGFYRRMFGYPDDKKLLTLSGLAKQGDFNLVLIDSEMKSYLTETEMKEFEEQSRSLFRSADYKLYRVKACEKA